MRRTIHFWFETIQLDRDLTAGKTRKEPRPRRPHELDPYNRIIDARLLESTIVRGGTAVAVTR